MRTSLINEIPSTLPEPSFGATDSGPVPPQFTPECGARDPERPGPGPPFAPVALAHGTDPVALQFGEGLGDRRRHRRPLPCRFVESEVARGDVRALRQDDRPLHGMLQFPDVAGPGM